MTKPVRLQLSRRKGFSLQALSLATNGLPAVNVARPSLWGNPFIVGHPSGWLFEDDGDPTPLIASLSGDLCVEFYREVCDGFLRPEHHPAGHRWRRDFGNRVKGFLPSEWARFVLRGRNLGCFCDPSERCHADVLLELANKPVCEAA
jgi:hypothetical protein